MAWSQANFPEHHYTVDEGYYESQPYQIPLSAVPVTASSPRGMVQQHSASYPHQYATPRYQPNNYIHTSPHHESFSFENYSWNSSSTVRGRSSSGSSNIYVDSSAASIATSPQEEMFVNGVGAQYPVRATQSIHPEQTSPAENYSTRATIHEDHGEIMTSQSSSTSSPSSEKTIMKDSKQHMCCRHQDCLDEFGAPHKFFSRKADVTRHYNSQHKPTHIDCPRKNCARKGTQGFTRKDHLIEHLRGLHMMNIPKREASHKASRSDGDPLIKKNGESNPLPPRASQQNGYSHQVSGHARMKHEREELIQGSPFVGEGVRSSDNSDGREASRTRRLDARRSRKAAKLQKLKEEHNYRYPKVLDDEAEYQSLEGPVVRQSHTRVRATSTPQVSNRPSTQPRASSDFVIHHGYPSLMYNVDASHFPPQFPPVTGMSS